MKYLFEVVLLLTFPVPILRNPPAGLPPTMTTTIPPLKPSIHDPQPLRYIRDRHPGKDKLPGLKDGERRKSIPQTANKNPKTKPLEPTMAQNLEKSANRKPVNRISPTEVD